jgi:hypothetical protein
VVSLLPSTGPLLGGTIVTVSGSFFRDVDPMYCTFGTHPRVPATWINPSSLLCVSPAESTPGTAALEVTGNNQDFSSSSIPFTYQSTFSQVLFYCI